MNPRDWLILMRGGGDLATGVAYRLHKAGFPVVVLELPSPLAVRRRVSLSTAVKEGQIWIEDLQGVRVSTFKKALHLAPGGIIPVLVSPGLPDLESEIGDQSWISPGSLASHTILIDGRMAKRCIDTQINQSPLVIALGPGFTAGVDCQAVIETKRGHRLGRVIWEGSAYPDTGTPGQVGGKGAERVLRAPVAGFVTWNFTIGDVVQKGDVLGLVGAEAVVAPFDGVLRGLIAEGTEAPSGLKIGDLDPRADILACFTISDKALAIGGGVLEAIMTWFQNER